MQIQQINKRNFMKKLAGFILFMTLISKSFAVDLVKEYPNNTNSRSSIVNESFDLNFFKQGDVSIMYHYFNDKFSQGGWGPFVSNTNTILVLKVKNLSYHKKFFIQYENNKNKISNLNSIYAGSDQLGNDYFHILIDSTYSNTQASRYKIITVLNFKYVDPGAPTYGREGLTWFDGVKGNKYEMEVQINR